MNWIRITSYIKNKLNSTYSTKDVVFERKFRADILIEEKILVENKAVKALTKQDEAQLLNYLKTTQLKVGLLFNFGSSKLEKIRMIL